MLWIGVNKKTQVVILYMLIIISTLTLLVPVFLYLIYKHNFDTGLMPYDYSYYINAIIVMEKGLLAFVAPIWVSLPAFISTLFIIKKEGSNSLLIFILCILLTVLFLSIYCIVDLESKDSVTLNEFMMFADDGGILIDGLKNQLNICVQLSISYLAIISGIGVAK